MTVFAISTRRIGQRNGVQVFGDEPSDPAFLIAPEGAATFAPEQRVAGPSAGKRWRDRVIGALPRTSDGKPAGDIVFFVHGYNVDAADAFAAHKTFSDALRNAGFEHVFVSFDWPSKGTITNYVEDSLDAAKAAPALVESGLALFASRAQPDCEARVHVIAHSMGAYVARCAFDFAPHDPSTRQAAWMINQMVLIAADVGSSSLAGDKAARMLAKAHRTTNYFSGYDAALATSNAKRLLTSPRAGRWGAPAEIRDRIADVDCSPRYEAFRRTQDGGSEIKRSHCWYFDDRDVFIPDLVETLRGDVDRRLLPRRRPDPVNPGRLLLE